jgi:hypothetical protein
MRSAASLLLLLLTLAGCDDRRSFDEKYDETAEELDQRAARLDAELNNDAAETVNRD